MIYLMYQNLRMTISKIRRDNARALAKGMGQAELAHRLDMADSQLSQNIGINPRRNIGDKLARRIEAACDKPAGWLDAIHPAGSNLMIEVSPEEKELIEVYRSSSTARILIDGAVKTSFSLPGDVIGGGMVDGGGNDSATKTALAAK